MASFLTLLQHPDAAMLNAYRLPRSGCVLVLLALTIAAPATSMPRGRGQEQRRADLIRRDVQQGQLRVAAGAPARSRLRAKPLVLEPGDLVSASTVKGRLLRLPADATKVANWRLRGYDFVPRALRYEASLDLLAIAAVTQVLLLSPTTGEVVVITAPDGEPFGFANDVLFDGNGGLIIADQGAEPTAALPLDGVVWRYDLGTAELEPIATNRDYANPKLLATDRKGQIHFVDGSAGELVSPVFDTRWDLVYVITGNKLNRSTVVWDEPGVQATAYAIDGSDWHWIVNVAELVRIRGAKFEQPCLPPYPLRFATGLTVDDDGLAMVADGADVLGKERAFYTLDEACTATLLTDRRLRGSRGLAYVPLAE